MRTSDESALEAGFSRSAPEALEMLLRVGDEVEVERREALLHDAPHRLAEIGHEAHQDEPVGVAATVGVEEGTLAALVELVVDGEVPEVEGGISHARVLPVDDPQA